MKKHIIAAAVAAAVAVPAIAQNVSVSGTLETGYIKQDVNNVSSHTVAGTVLNTNNITFSGSEDLGGGLKVGFKIMDEFTTNNGDDTASSEGMWAETSLTLSGGFGEIKAGKFSHAARDLGGVYRFGNEFARLSGIFRSLGDGANKTHSIQYTSPAMNGITVALAYGNQGTDAAAAATPNDVSMLVRYASGPLTVAYGRLTRDAGVAGTKNAEQLIGGQYDFGTFKIGALYASEKDKANDDATAYVVNLLYPIGNGVSVLASYHSVDESVQGSAKGGGIALLKDFSKRTTGYVGYLNMKNTNMSEVYTMSGMGSNNQTDSAYAIGVRHNF